MIFRIGKTLTFHDFISSYDSRLFYVSLTNKVIRKAFPVQLRSLLFVKLIYFLTGVLYAIFL